MDGGLKRYLPKALFGRALIILLAPVLLVQGVVAVLIVQRHYEGVTAQLASAVGAELNYLVAAIEAAETLDEARADLARASGPLTMQLFLEDGRIVEREALRRFYDVTGGALEEALKVTVRRPMTLDLLSSDKQVRAQIQTDKGVLHAHIERRRLTTSNPHQIFVWMAGSSALLIAIAILFLRNQVRPIRELAAAAEAFGKGRPTRFHPAGAEEVRRAGSAFLDMRARIQRQIESRTRMLSGVSHDLRTPLTRMKLALAMMDRSPETEEVARDVEEMERMIEAFLAFARGEASEAPTPADPVALVEAVAADQRRQGRAVAVGATVETPEAPEMPLRVDALRRAVGNLVENAAVYAGHAEIDVRLGPRWLDISVEDDGPGIPADQRETALKPFTLIDAARNQDFGGGVGLGLSIAAEVARAHGGALSLDDSPRLGGLRARLRLPR